MSKKDEEIDKMSKFLEEKNYQFYEQEREIKLLNDMLSKSKDRER